MTPLQNFGRHTRIAFRLGIAIAIPALAVAFLGAISIADNWQVMSKMRHIQALSQYSTRVSDLVHELQKE